MSINAFTENNYLLFSEFVGIGMTLIECFSSASFFFIY